jgi:2-methylcitrate dehydratase PrpD
MTDRTIIEELAQWSSGLKYDDIPPRVRAKARLQLYSVLGAIFASSRHEIGKAVLAAVEGWAGSGPCTVIPTGKKVDLLAAVYANAALSIALDYDDYLLFGHTGHSAVCVSLAVAEMAGASFPETLTAQVIANEIEGRIGASVVIGPHNGQAWSHIHLAGAAAAASKLMKLTPEQTAHAMAIAMYQPTYVLFPGFMGPDSKATTAATPCVTGVQAALLARSGATGPLDVIEHPQGFLAHFSYAPAPFFFSGLGRAWTTDTLAYKIYPGCAYIDTTVDAVLALRRRFREDTGAELAPDEVADVLVEGTILTVEMDHLSKVGGAFDPLNPVSINFSIPGNVAIALLKGRLTADDLSRAALKESADPILRLCEKVRLVHDWSLTVRFLQAMDSVINIRAIAAELKITDLVSARLKMRDQYKSAMGLTLGDLRQLWASTPELGGRLWSVVKERAAAAINREDDGYDLGLRPLENFTMPFAARVTITFKGGRTMTHLQEIPWAGPGHPLDKTKENVLNKLLYEARGVVGGQKIEKIQELADDVENLIAVPKFIELCTA